MHETFIPFHGRFVLLAPKGMNVNMSRTSVFIETKLTREEIGVIVERYMREKGFRAFNYKGEAVLKKSGISGLFMVPIYLKVQKQDDGVRVEGWARSFGEHGLSGKVGLLPKYMLQKAMRGLIDEISPLEEN